MNNDTRNMDSPPDHGDDAGAPIFGIFDLRTVDPSGILVRIEPRTSLVEHVAEMIVALSPDRSSVESLVQIRFVVEDDGTSDTTPANIRYVSHAVTPVVDSVEAQRIWDEKSADSAWVRAPNVLIPTRQWPFRNFPETGIGDDGPIVTRRFFDCFGGGAGDPGPHMCSLLFEFYVESSPVNFPLVTRLN